jgi:hypothetical protein
MGHPDSIAAGTVAGVWAAGIIGGGREAEACGAAGAAGLGAAPASATVAAGRCGPTIASSPMLCEERCRSCAEGGLRGDFGSPTQMGMRLARRRLVGTPSPRPWS